MRCFSHIDAVHKRLAPFRHWFLWALGVDPRFRGKGYASKLLKPMFAKIDMESLPCYVETMDEKGVSIYQHYGFEVVEKSTIPRTNLNIWAMLRSKPEQ